MAIKFIKSLKQMAGGDSLTAMLHKHLTGWDPHRGTARIHASELTKSEGFCPRFFAISDHVPSVLKDQWLSTSEQVTFQMGRDLQDNVVNWLANTGKVIGHWRCYGCGHEHRFQKRPPQCEKCGGKGFKPEEVRFQSEECGASCGVDCLVDMGKPKLTPVEIKTMDKDQFKTLKAPLAEHRLRTNLYLRIIAESGHNWADFVDTSEARVLYTSKGGYGCAQPELKAMGISDHFSPFKEYIVKRDDAETDYLVQRSKVVKLYREGEVGMPDGICSTAMIPRAQKCTACKVCFSGDYPPSYDWKP